MTPGSAAPTPPADWTELERRFDACYAAAVRLNAEHAGRLCAIGGGGCARSSSRSGVASFCCGGMAEGERDFPGNLRCTHLGEDGCTVESLQCRLWFCDAIALPLAERSLGGSRRPFCTVRHPAFLALLREADRCGFLVHRGTRAESLSRAAAKWALPARSCIFGHH